MGRSIHCRAMPLSAYPAPRNTSDLQRGNSIEIDARDLDLQSAAKLFEQLAASDDTRITFAGEVIPCRTPTSFQSSPKQRIRHSRGTHRDGPAGNTRNNRRPCGQRRRHRLRARPRDAGAARRVPAHRPALPAVRAPDPPHRHRHPRDPLLLVVPAAAGGRATRREGAAGDDDARPGRGAKARAGRRWVDLEGDGALGRTVDEAAKARQRAARTAAAAATRRAAARSISPS